MSATTAMIGGVSCSAAACTPRHRASGAASRAVPVKSHRGFRRHVMQGYEGVNGQLASSSSSTKVTATRRVHAAAKSATDDPAAASSGDRPSLEERLAAALAEDTSLPKNPNPLPLPPLPDLRELAVMAALEVTDEEVEDWTPKVHGILNWFGELNEVDIAAVSKEVKLYRDEWVMPLREDEPVDFANR